MDLDAAKDRLIAEVDRHTEGLLDASHRIHEHPELLFEERYAAELLCDMLEGAGLKGARLGDAAFSERHANFIVNLGRARAADVKGLMDLATRVVRRRLGVELEPEVRLVGEW